MKRDAIAVKHCIETRRGCRFHDLLKLVPWSVFDRLVKEHGSDEFVRGFDTRRQLIALLYRQFSGAESLRAIETAQALVEAIGEAPSDRPLLIDCLTLWLSNRLLAGADLSRDRAALVHILSCRAAPTVTVSSEVGLSIVPDNALARSFRDAAGELHQAVSRIAGRVALVVAGNPLIVKGGAIN